VSRSDTERLRDIVECIDAIYRAELTVQRDPDDDDVAQVGLVPGPGGDLQVA